MRCGKCDNCIKLESEKRLTLMMAQPYHLVKGRLVVDTNPQFDNEAWNRTVESLPCLTKYQAKVRFATDYEGLTWEARDIWAETQGDFEFFKQSSLDHLSIFQPSAEEIRINEVGSLQGHYFDVPQLNNFKLEYVKVNQVKVGDILSDNGRIHWKRWEGSDKALTVIQKGGRTSEFILTDGLGREYRATGQRLTSYGHTIVIRKIADKWWPIGRFFCKYW